MRESTKFQVLIVTTRQNDFSLLDRMHVSSDAIIGNQIAESNSVQSIEYKNHNVTMYSSTDRGVGKNRNRLMMCSDADIILFADDDVIYDDGYAEIVIKAFEDHPEADGITFNVVPIPDSINPDLNVKWHRIRWYNSLKYGAPRLALRMRALREKNVYYSLLFGGGAKYYSGEDSLFIMDCLRSGMRLYGCPEKIGSVTFETSTWYEGFNEKYFKDKGLFFYFLSKRFSKLLCFQYCVRRNGLFKEYCSPHEAFQLMLNGIRDYKKGLY